MGCRTENVRSRGRTSAKTLIRVMANGRENRECKKSKKQLRKRRTTLCNGKGSHTSWGLERSATSVSHQDSGIKTLTNPHSYPHLSLSSTSFISTMVFSLFKDNARAPCKCRGQALRGSLQTRKQGACPRGGCRCASCTLCPAPTFTWSLG